MMPEIEASAVSDKDVMDWLKDYAVPRVRAMRAMNALREVAEPVVKADEIPELVMRVDEYDSFRRIIGALRKTESLAWAFEPELDGHKLASGVVGHIFGFMAVRLDKDCGGVVARAEGHAQRAKEESKT